MKWLRGGSGGGPCTTTTQGGGASSFALPARLGIVVACACLLAGVAAPRNAQAIPAFARKYATSCTTCHAGFPRLNAFGEAFRLAGYQIPDGDEAYLKQEPVSLGSDAWKHVWPQAIWPSQIPPAVPLAIRATSGVVSDLSSAAVGGKRGNIDFRVPTALNLYGAGNLSEDISLWMAAHLNLNGQTGELGKLYAQFSNLADAWLPRQSLNLRFGMFVPGALAFDHHRNLTFATSLVSTANAVTGVARAVGHAHSGAGGGHGGDEAAESSYNGAFALGTTQVGGEIFGLLGSRADWLVGFVNGSGPGADPNGGGNFDPNGAKDLYLRARYKLGGMGFDGTPVDSLGDSEAGAGAGADSGDDVPSLGSDDPNAGSERSLIIGAMAYYGRHRMQAQTVDTHTLFDSSGNPIYLAVDEVMSVAVTNTMSYSNRVRRVGGDLQLLWGGLEATALVAYGDDSNPRGDASGVTTLLQMVQLDWTLPWPWLITTLRYEAADFAAASGSLGGGVSPRDARQLVAGITGLVRANVRLQIEGQIDLRRKSGETPYDLLAAVLDASF